LGLSILSFTYRMSDTSSCSRRKVGLWTAQTNRFTHAFCSRLAKRQRGDPGPAPACRGWESHVPHRPSRYLSLQRLECGIWPQASSVTTVHRSSDFRPSGTQLCHSAKSDYQSHNLDIADVSNQFYPIVPQVAKPGFYSFRFQVGMECQRRGYCEKYGEVR
jgi:hypothetical protein